MTRHLTPTRTDGYVDLRSYAAIGDGRTVALIALDGSIDWLPVPSLDSVPPFARLLDADAGGSIELEPVDAYTVSRRYVPGTNVLESTYTTDAGTARVTDALVTGIAGRLPWVELARRTDGLTGSVRFRWRVTPGTMFDTASPWKDDTAHGRALRVDGVTLAVRGILHNPGNGGERALAGGFETHAGSRHLVTMVGTADEPLHLPIAEKTDIGIDRTIENWRMWSREFNYDGPWAEQVQRSALALKLLIFAPTGAIAAAPTTSLPESAGGGKNWDYRYAWVRDAAYTVHALTRFGLREETQASVAWLVRTIREHGPNPHIFYRLDGSDPGDVVQQNAPGWRGIGPVVAGNPAAEQVQHGVYGDLLGMMLNYVRAGNVLDVATAHMLVTAADHVCDAWRSPDSGMWELPDQRRYTSSAMGSWQALDAAISLTELGEIPGTIERWTRERDAIAEWVAENCWSEERQSYVHFAGTDELDASVLLHAPSGFDRGERMSRTTDALRAELGRGPLMYRYSGAQAEEGAFVACSFWLAATLACVGRRDEAVTLMDELVGLSNDVGLFAEMIEPDDGSFWGNLPQGLSHLALVNAAITIEEVG
ncbi:MAG: glycoside hydrolase family 15 protein [Microbacteriaceae bacterium]